MSRFLIKVLLVILFLPLLQQGLELVEERRLGGTDTSVESVDFSTRDWLSGDYQKGVDATLQKETGFRNSLIRLNNQINYWLFGEISTVNIVMGKEGYLFDTGYIHAHYGNDFIGDTVIQNRVKQLSLVRDTLLKLGTELLVVFAPSKGSFYPEYFPDKFIQDRAATNYDFYKKEIEKYAIPNLDFNAWFRAIKDTTRYPLFPKTGIHWSEYGVALTADSLLRHIEQSLQIDVPDFQIDSVVWSDQLRGTDQDIEVAMNLLLDLDKSTMAYAKMTWQIGAQRPKVIAIGDSFYWNWYRLGIPKKSFAEAEFWYYNKMVHPYPNDKKIDPRDYDYRKKLPEQDLIILIATEPSLINFAWEFIELAHQAFYDSDNYLDPMERARLKRILAMEKRIRNNEKWYADIVIKAKRKNITVETALREDAIFMVDRAN